MATIRDIAKRAGISVAAVSLAINGKPGVGEQTRQRVQEIAADLGYRPPERAARSAPKNGIVRFLKVAQHGHTVNRDHNIFIADYIDGLSEVAQAANYTLEVVPCDGVPIDDLVSGLSNREASGAVVLGTELTFKQVQAFSRLRTPLVFIDTDFPYLPFDFVDMDNTDAVFKAIECFVEAGHREIGMVTSPVEVRNFRLRDEGFLKACDALNVQPGSRTRFEVDSTYDGALSDMTGHLKRISSMPSALFCANDMIAYGVVEALRLRGTQVPTEISVIGFDNLPQSARHTPPLHTIDVRKHLIGSVAMQLLTDRMEGSGSVPPRKVRIGVELVERESVHTASRE